MGSLVIAADSQIGSIEQLAGKRIGVAGGPIDKSWLILQAWAKRQMGFDISRSAQPVFAAPPLLNSAKVTCMLSLPFGRMPLAWKRRGSGGSSSSRIYYGSAY
jgi:NitT/TauT family transport system substrate-binding protein